MAAQKTKGTDYFTFTKTTDKGTRLREEAARSAAKVLGVPGKLFGLDIQRKQQNLRIEQISYPVSDTVKDYQRTSLSYVMVEFLAALGLQRTPEQLMEDIRTFDGIFRDVTISNLNDGMGYNNGLVFFCYVRAIAPHYVIESGVWRGFTTYLLNAATPDAAQIKSFDISLAHVEYRSPKAEYFEHDILKADLDIPNQGTLALFDDHVSHYDRLKYALDNNIQFLIFDDDVSVSTVHSDGWPPIPTANMVMNYNHIPHHFEWVYKGRAGKADISGLSCDDLQNAYTYVPMPELFDYTGYRNTSATSYLVRK